MPRTHHYEMDVTWTGNRGTGTSAHQAYDRRHRVSADGKAPIPGSGDPSRHGAPDRWNPEELLVASVSQCHMLCYLRLCVNAGIVVTAYTDRPYGTMVATPDGSGQFTEVRLRPRVTISTSERVDRAVVLHERAHEACFIANSVNFAIRHEPIIFTEPVPTAIRRLRGQKAGAMERGPGE